MVGAGEEALRAAYELGRAAVSGGKGLLDVAAVHHVAVASLLERVATRASIAQNLERASLFFGEVLSPYEMAHRGFRDTVVALRRLNETLEQEIQRIAHAVHDEAGQLLVGARLAMAGVAKDLDPANAARLEEVGVLLGRVDEELRSLARELRPTILDDLGLVAALESLGGRMSKRSGLSVRIEGSLQGRCDPNVETTLFRVVQEALANVARHAEAKTVTIHLGHDARQLFCVIRDDGRGFDVASVFQRRGRAGLGLIGMRERLNAVGGMLQIHSEPDRGTELRVRIPVEW